MRELPHTLDLSRSQIALLVIQRREVVAHPRTLESSVARVSFSDVAIVGPMAQFLPSVLLVAIQRQRIRHTRLELGMIYGPTVCYAAKRGDKKWASSGHLCTMH